MSYKAMVVNTTVQYEHDMPVVRSVVLAERPPIPRQEQEKMVLRMDSTHTYNPSMNQVITTRKLTYGKQSSTSKPVIDVSSSQILHGVS